MSDDHRSVPAGILAGMIGGIVGTLAMNGFQTLWSKVIKHDSESASGHHDGRDWQEREENQNANELAAQAVALRTLDRRLTRKELRIAAPLVHFGFGAAMGALYGGLAENLPSPGPAAGAGFGTALWIGADEIAIPALGLSRATAAYGFETHAQALAAHLVYGVTTELVRHTLRGRGEARPGRDAEAP